MNNLEENLKKIKIRDIGEEDKESLWHRIITARVMEEQKKSWLLSISIFNFNNMNKLIVGALALVLILGGGSMVAASNSAVPGDFLFPVDLAIEKLQLKFIGEDGKTELKLKFAEERVAEIKHVSEEKSEPETNSIKFSKQESEDVGRALTDLEELLEGSEGSERALKIEKALQELLVLLGDEGDLEIRKKDGEIRIKSDSFRIEIKSEKEDKDQSNDSDENDEDDSSDDDSDDEDEDDRRSSNTVRNGDVKEREDEVFCRGEWRDQEDCDDRDDKEDEEDDGDKDEDEEDNDDNSG
ncbi:MAG: DUF5667 domain-containing protein [bacterium]|nr:DUF5667 domain-containing protein [bacterium]